MGELGLLILKQLNVKLIFLLLILLHGVGLDERQINFICENINMLKVSRVTETAEIVGKAKVERLVKEIFTLDHGRNFRCFARV
jgi:hypothetical protein